jgi:hypothetical protein
VEDLGAININIRELGGGGGGGGGSGQTGGGPAFMARNALKTGDILGPLTRVQEFVSNNMGRITATLTRSQQVGEDVLFASRTALLAMQQDKTKAAGFASTLRGELADFFRAPSIGGYARLTQEGTATSTTLKLLGSTGKVLNKALFGLSVVGSVASLALAGLRKATEHVASRIESVGKFSGAILAANVEQRVQQLRDQLQEAAENGDFYARSIRAQTLEMQANAYMNRQLGVMTSSLSTLFSVLKAAVYAVVGGLTAFFTLSIRLPDLMAKMATPFMQRILDSAIPGTSLYGLRQILVYLGVISDNTKPKSAYDPHDINAWFQADILAMTGRTY